MLAANFIWFYLCFVAVPKIISSTQVNTTSLDGKVFISGDHNEVTVSAGRESKIAVAEIKRRLGLVEKKDKEFSKKLQALDERMLSLDKIRGNRLNVMNQTIENLSKTVESLHLATAYALLFPHKGTSDYVIKRGMPSLKAVTVCLWMKSSDKGNAGTPLSYAVSGTDNELLLLDYRKFHIFVGGSSSATSVSANDGKWHHICATWENTAGTLKLYKDGSVAAASKGIKTGHVIRGGGVLVLGQEQESVGGSFDAIQSFIGELTGVNIWDHVLKEQEIMRMSKSCLAGVGVGNVFQWYDFKPHVKGSVQIIKPTC